MCVRHSIEPKGLPCRAAEFILSPPAPRPAPSAGVCFFHGTIPLLPPPRRLAPVPAAAGRNAPHSHPQANAPVNVSEPHVQQLHGSQAAPVSAGTPKRAFPPPRFFAAVSSGKNGTMASTRPSNSGEKQDSSSRRSTPSASLGCT